MTAMTFSAAASARWRSASSVLPAVWGESTTLGAESIGLSAAGGSISGGVYNPAIGSGALLIHAFLDGGDLGNLWIYLVGPFLGGALAAMVFRLQEAPELDVS